MNNIGLYLQWRFSTVQILLSITKNLKVLKIWALDIFKNNSKNKILNNCIKEKTSSCRINCIIGEKRELYSCMLSQYCILLFMISYKQIYTIKKKINRSTRKNIVQNNFITQKIVRRNSYFFFFIQILVGIRKITNYLLNCI